MTLPTLRVIQLTSEELATKRLSSHNLQASLQALHQDGILAIENAVNTTHLDRLNERMIPEAQDSTQTPTPTATLAKKPATSNKNPSSRKATSSKTSSPIHGQLVSWST